MTYTVRDGLVRVRELLEAGWVPRCPNSLDSNSACCIITACSSVATETCEALAMHQLYQPLRRCLGSDLATWNDTHSKEEVLALLDLAIATENVPAEMNQVRVEGRSQAYADNRCSGLGELRRVIEDMRRPCSPWNADFIRGYVEVYFELVMCKVRP